MNSKNFNDDVNPLTNRTASSSGGAPEPFNKEGGPESLSWDWNIYVEPLQPGETATCHVMLGVDDNGSLKVDGKGIEIPGVGKYHGGTYREKSDSFSIEPGYHKVSMTYENVALPPDWKNLAILAYTYNHLNLLTQIVDDSGTRTIAYTQYNETESETTSGLVASALHFQRDTLGRPSGYNLRYAASTAQQTAWGYDTFGRLSTVSMNAVAVPFTYGYNADNGLLDTLDYPGRPPCPVRIRPLRLHREDGRQCRRDESVPVLQRVLR